MAKSMEVTINVKDKTRELLSRASKTFEDVALELEKLGKTIEETGAAMEKLVKSSVTFEQQDKPEE